jgi:hypothetical protein
MKTGRESNMQKPKGYQIRSKWVFRDLLPTGYIRMYLRANIFRV